MESTLNYAKHLEIPLQGKGLTISEINYVVAGLSAIAENMPHSQKPKEARLVRTPPCSTKLYEARFRGLVVKIFLDSYSFKKENRPVFSVIVYGTPKFNRSTPKRDKKRYAGSSPC